MRAFILLVLIFWLTRIAGLEALPLHNSEGLHLTRAIEVWNLHPFWEIRDGKTGQLPSFTLKTRLSFWGASLPYSSAWSASQRATG